MNNGGHKIRKTARGVEEEEEEEKDDAPPPPSGDSQARCSQMGSRFVLGGRKLKAQTLHPKQLQVLGVNAQTPKGLLGMLQLRA